MLSNKTYDALKWIAILFLPALATWYRAIAVIWNLPYADEVPQTLIAIETFLGAILGVSTIDYKAKQEMLEEAKKLNAQD